jgi:GTP cyclohydrolase I
MNDNLLETDEVRSRFNNIISSLIENSVREGLLKSPERSAKAIQFFTEGYNKDPNEILERVMFSESYNEMVIVKDIELYSLYEHHLFPFFGKAHIAYIPNGTLLV